mgnify:CR=1 FL=1
MKNSTAGSLKALIPFVIFVAVFLSAGIYYNDFYALPAPVAVIIGILSAYFILKGSIPEKTATFLEGCGNKNILTMCIIYLLAGAFATVSKSIGSVDAIVALGLNTLSPVYYAAGVFVLASFLSIASGTSVGTIVALGPIAIGLATAGGCDMNVVGAALLCGAMFGDNLSFISDTTITAVRTQGAEMKDKFKVNFFIVLPAAIVTCIILAILTFGETAVVAGGDYSFVKIIPYLFVIVFALIGMNVFVVLASGIGLAIR